MFHTLFTLYFVMFLLLFYISHLFGAFSMSSLIHVLTLTHFSDSPKLPMYSPYDDVWKYVYTYKTCAALFIICIILFATNFLLRTERNEITIQTVDDNGDGNGINNNCWVNVIVYIHIYYRCMYMPIYEVWTWVNTWYVSTEQYTRNGFVVKDHHLVLV